MIELLGIEFSQNDIFFGLVTGLTYAALAAGFVLVYRSTGVLNFAHGEIGVFGLALFVMAIVNYGLNWWLAFVLAIAGSALVGMLTELIVVRRLFTSPRLVLLIATVGVGQILTLARVGWIPDINSGGSVPTAFELKWELTDHLTVQARELTVIIIVPILVLALGLFLTKTRFGLAVRASASNPDTARVYGTSPRRVSTIVWTISGALAAATAILTAPLQNVQSAAVDQADNALVGELLLKVLVVSLLARMRSLPGAVAAGIGVGLTEKLVRENVESVNPTDLAIVNVYFFIAVLVIVLWFVRSTSEDASWSLSPTRRAIPERLRQVWWVRNLNRMGFVALFGALAVVPMVVSSSAEIFEWTNVLVLALVALSLSVLTGWAGQLSLGQFAFVGVGGFATVAFTNGHDIPIPFDLFDLSIEVPWLVAVVLAVTVGVVAALLVGLPALRVRGLFLAVTTLAFAVATSTWLIRQDFFTGGTTPRPVDAPTVFGYDFDASRHRHYFLCLIVLALVGWIVSRIRATGIGRTFIAVRENEEMASASTVSPARAKLSAFAISGGISALAGSLLVTIQPSLSLNSFQPTQSVQVVVVAIIGGLGSVAGPILGAMWVEGFSLVTPDDLKNLQQLFTSNIGLLVLLMYFPGGLLQIVYSARDALLARAEARLPEEVAGTEAAVAKAVPTRHHERVELDPSVPALAVHGATVRFGGNVAVDAVDIHVMPGELVGLIGTNGAGKSTLLNAVSGFVPAEGRFEVLGRDVSKSFATARHQLGLGRGFQAARLYPDLTVRESLMVALEARQRSLLVPSMLALPPSPGHERTKRAEADEIIDYLGLGRYADQVVGALSTGTRRIVELGSLLAVDARVLLLDEPTGGVAQRETEAFGPLIKRIQEELEAAVVVIEHDMPLVMSISDRVYCLESGSVIAEGTPDEVRNDPLVVASYLGTDERAIQRSGAAGSGAADDEN